MPGKLSMPGRNKPAVPRSQAERMWLTGAGIVAFALLLIGYFFFISPQRGNTSSVRSQIADAQTQNSVLQGRIDQLRAQSKNLSKYRTELAAAKQALPSTSGVSDFVRSLQSLGGATSTSVSALSVGAPKDVSTLAAAAPAPTATAATPTASPSASASTSGVLSIGGPGVYALVITASVTGKPTALDQFLDQLQHVQPRAVLITSLTENTGSGTPNTTAQGSTLSGATTLQISMEAFVAPSSPSESASLSSAAGH